MHKWFIHMNDQNKDTCIIQGRESGCPFCGARFRIIPEIGTRFRIISGYNAGETGTVVEWPKNFPPLPNEFLEQMDSEPTDIQSRVLLEHELVQILPPAPTPDWAPPLCLRDAAELDSVVLYFCNTCYHNAKWKLDWQSFYEVTRKIWTLRLPLEPSELWLVLYAHGIPERWQKRLSVFYLKGKELLVYSVGKRPIKKKKVSPFSA
jgi:hypothetical protein